MSETETSERWRELLDKIAGQAHSALVANAAFGHSPRYHDHPNKDECHGASCQWYVALKAELNAQGALLRELAMALRQLPYFNVGEIRALLARCRAEGVLSDE